MEELNLQIETRRGHLAGCPLILCTPLCNPNLPKEEADKDTDCGSDDIAHNLPPHLAVAALQFVQPPTLLFLFLDHALHTLGLSTAGNWPARYRPV